MMQRILLRRYFSRLWTHKDDFKDINNLKGYLYGIAMNVYREWARRRKARLLLVPRVEPAVAAELERLDAFDRELSEERSRTWANALEQLSPEDRMLIAEYYGGGIDRGQLAKKMGLTSSAMRLRVHRIRNRLTASVKNS